YVLVFSTPRDPPEVCTLSLHDALPISILKKGDGSGFLTAHIEVDFIKFAMEELRKNSPQIDSDILSLAISDLERNLRKISIRVRSEEHTSELQSRFDLVCRLLLEKKK